MESTGSFEYCKKVLKTLGERARKLVTEVESTNDGAAEESKGGGVMKILEKMVV